MLLNFVKKHVYQSQREIVYWNHTYIYIYVKYRDSHSSFSTTMHKPNPVYLSPSEPNQQPYACVPGALVWLLGRGLGPPGFGGGTVPRGFCPGLAAGFGLMGGAGFSSSPDFRSVTQELGYLFNVSNDTLFDMYLIWCEVYSVKNVLLASSTCIWI